MPQFARPFHLSWVFNAFEARQFCASLSTQSVISPLAVGYSLYRIDYKTFCGDIKNVEKGKRSMNIAELTAAAATLRQIEAQIGALRGAFLVAGDIAFARQANDIGILVSDLIQGLEREIAAKQKP